MKKMKETFGDLVVSRKDLNDLKRESSMVKSLSTNQLSSMLATAAFHKIQTSPKPTVPGILFNVRDFEYLTDRAAAQTDRYDTIPELSKQTKWDSTQLMRSLRQERMKHLKSPAKRKEARKLEKKSREQSRDSLSSTRKTKKKLTSYYEKPVEKLC